MSTATEALHLYEVEEGEWGVRHWVIARSEEHACEFVRETGTDEDLAASVIDDAEPWTVTYVDGFNFPDRWQEEVPPGATVQTDEHGRPEVTVTAGEWVKWMKVSSYFGCSEY
jgi:hypothetical protein